MKKQYEIYTVEDWPEQNGKWGGYRTSVTSSEGKQGKLYVQKDGRDHYKAKPDTEELEI
jgi:hypothetical protein